jgi:hypothetical protein
MTLVILKEAPDSLLNGLPLKDQMAIKAVVGKPVVLVSIDNGEAELDFVDDDGYGHTIWVADDLIKGYR